MSEALIFDHYPLAEDQAPPGWAITSVGHIARLIASGFPSGKHNQDGVGVPHVRPMNIDREGRLDLNSLKYVDGAIPRDLSKGDVLFNNTNSPELIGKTTVVSIDRRLAYSNHMTRISLEDGLDPTFIARQLHFLWLSGYFRHRCANHVNQASIAATPFSSMVPIAVAPTSEQSRIGEALEELFFDLDAGAAALEKARDKLALYRAAVLKAAVDGALTANWRERHPQVEPASELLKRILVERRRRWEQDQLRQFEEKGRVPPKSWRGKYREPESFATVPLLPLPEGWCWASLDQLGSLDRGRSRHRPRNAEFLYGGPYPFIQTGDVRGAQQYIREHTQTYSRAGLEQSRLWPAATLCVTIAANIANTAILSYPACFPDSIVGVSFDESSVSVRYVEMYIRSVRTRIEAYAPATAQKNINNTVLRTLPVPLPPVDEQYAIVEAADIQLSTIEHVESVLNDKLKTARELRQAILRHAFGGRLVPQDPNDEPASELLTRIAAEREARAREARIAQRKKPVSRRRRR